MMLSEYQLSLITAMGTIGATFVALFIVIVPAILQKSKLRKLSYGEIKNGLWMLQEIIRGYFYFNPTRILLKANDISYTYDLKNVHITLNFNETEIIGNVKKAIVNIRKKDAVSIQEIINNSELLFSGLPQHNSYWISIDNELTQIRYQMFNDKRISIKDTIEEIFTKSIGLDK